MKDLRMALSLLKGLGNLICTTGVVVPGIIITGAGTGIGAGACLEVLIFGFGAGCLGYSSSLLVSSSVVSVSYLLLLGVAAVLGSILNVAGLDSLLVGLTVLVLVTASPWMILVAMLNSLLVGPVNVAEVGSLDLPPEVAVAVEVNTLDLPPVVSAGTVAW